MGSPGADADREVIDCALRTAHCALRTAHRAPHSQGVALNRPGKIVCVGRNYAAHAKELGNTVPDKPLLFFKPPSSVIGDGEPIILPTAYSKQVEHEGEVGVVIGTRVRNVAEKDARKAIA